MSFQVRVCLPAAVVLLIASGGADAETGFYVGATAGESVFHAKASKFDAEVVDGWNVINVAAAPLSLSMVLDSSSLNESHLAHGGLVGYRFTPAFSIEAAYIDLGQLHYVSHSTVTFRSRFSTLPFVEPASADTTAKARGWTLTALGILPLSPTWEIYGRAGISFSKVTFIRSIGLDVSLHAASFFGAGAGSFNTATGNSVDPLVGAGVAWHLPWHVTLRGEYTRFINVGNRDKTGEINIDLFNLGVTYSFR